MNSKYRIKGGPLAGLPIEGASAKTLTWLLTSWDKNVVKLAKDLLPKFFIYSVGPSGLFLVESKGLLFDQAVSECERKNQTFASCPCYIHQEAIDRKVQVGEVLTVQDFKRIKIALRVEFEEKDLIQKKWHEGNEAKILTLKKYR